MWSGTQELKINLLHESPQTQWRHSYLTAKCIHGIVPYNPNSQTPAKPIRQHFRRYLSSSRHFSKTLMFELRWRKHYKNPLQLSSLESYWNGTKLPNTSVICRKALEALPLQGSNFTFVINLGQRGWTTCKCASLLRTDRIFRKVKRFAFILHCLFPIMPFS